MQDGGGNFFNAFGGGREPTDACSAHHRLGLRDLVPAIGHTRVLGVGSSLIANLAQSLGMDGQAKGLGQMLF